MVSTDTDIDVTGDLSTVTFTDAESVHPNGVV